MSIRRSKRKQNKKTFTTQFCALLGIAFVLALVWHLFLSDYVAEKMAANETFSIITSAVIAFIFISNGLYAFAYSRISGLLEGEPNRIVSNMIPVLTDFNLRHIYEVNECTGPLPVITLGAGVLKSVVFWGGLAYVYLRYGFLYFFDPHTYWIVGSFVVFAIYNVLKCITFGVIYASYDDYLTSKFVNLFYIKYIIYGIVILLYFVVLVPASVFFEMETIVIDSKIINFLTIILPFLLPVLSVIDACKVRSQTERVLQSYEDDEDYYDDYED